ncbi:MAG: hypothetical protein KF869_11230 [Phycisphaeraceae bacterium]|nr:hypothetical protein [Phycisphaeraceae bacterium]
MTRARRLTPAAVLVAVCGTLAIGNLAAAQSSQPPSKTKVVRRPVVDLKKQAEEPRPGQVMPGQPSPEAPPAEPPPAQPQGDPPVQQQPAAPARPAVDIPDSEPARPAQQPAPMRPIRPAPVPVQDQRPAQEHAPAVRPQADAAPAPAAPPEPVARVRAEPDPIPTLRVAEPEEPAPQPKPEISPAAASAPARPAAAQPGAAGTAKPGEAVSARVSAIDGPADVIEWRGLGEEWSPIAAGATASGRLEVRTGLGASATFVIDDQVEIKVLRLSRVRFERREPSGPGLPAEIVVEVNRGEVDIKPRPALVAGAATAVIRIVTPDKNFATRLPTGVRYDAFSGTRTRVLSAERHR